MMVLSSSVDNWSTQAPFVIVAGAANGAAEARGVAEAAGTIVIEAAGWDRVAEMIDAYAGQAALVLETEGHGEAELAAALPPIDDAASAAGMPVVVSLDPERIDVVAASMVRSRCELLCAPSRAERVVAVTIATGRLADPGMADGVREGEAARLQRLNEEVARIADVLSKLTRRDGERPSPAVGEMASVFRQPDGIDDIVIDPAEVRRAIRARRLRDHHFGPGLFEDPAWEILLDLFAAELERTQVSVSSLCIAASVAPTTALRWIAKLTEAGLLERHPDPFDRRRAFMELSPRAGRAMRDHVAALRRAGLPFG